MTTSIPESGSEPADHAESSPPHRDPRLWHRPVPVGYGPGFTAFATIAAPLLAGFSLTAIVTLSSSQDHRGTRGDVAIAAFSVATVLMLFTLQAGIAATQRAVLPDQRAAQYPEARHMLGWMQQLRLDQWRDETLAKRLMNRCRWTYNLGIIAFLGGHRPDLPRIAPGEQLAGTRSGRSSACQGGGRAGDGTPRRCGRPAIGFR